ncbi:MAG: PAS domain-containing protein [Verrucomicrobia bacterium]|nr:PAS domain-containing protein [Verrucomicrobiota bacterium]
MSANKPNGTAAHRRKFQGRLDPRYARLVRPLLWALVITLLLYGLAEIVERTWLTGVDMEVRHVVHTVRGIFFSLLVAGVVGWMILRTSPGFLAVGPVGEEWVQHPWLSEADRAKTYAQWFIAMRWIAVLVAGLLVVVTVKIMKWLPAEVWWPLVLTVVALAVINVLYVLLIRWERGVPVVLIAQAYIDLVILTVLLQFSGGVENALSTMMVFHVIIGGILLSRRQCYGIAATGSLLFALLIWAEWAEVVGHYTLELYPHSPAGRFHPAHHTLYVVSSGIFQFVILFLTAYFVTTLAERLRENERRLEAMAGRALADRQLLERSLETTGTGLRVLDPDSRPRWASNRWQEWFVSQESVVCPGCELLDREDSPARQCLQDGRIRVTELTLDAGNCPSKFFQPDTKQHVFQITSAPLVDAAGKVHQVVELAQDITQQKQTQTQMMRAGKLAAVGELAGQVAHEVNNPIAIISAKARLLLSDHREEMSPKIAQELGKITDLSNRVARIAQGLLSYCRPSPATRARLDLRQPIRKSLAMVEQHAREIGVAVQDELPETLPPVKANASELEQVFLNLFLNALDAMPQGGRLKVSAASDALQDGQAAVAVAVEDTGVGIPETIRDRIFEPFFTTKQEGRGTGLGLSICLGLVRSHGGGIEVKSELGRGSRFTIKLPVEAVARKEPLHG